MMRFVCIEFKPIALISSRNFYLFRWLYTIMFRWRCITSLKGLQLIIQNIVVNWHHTGKLQWRHNECDGVSNHWPHDCLLNRLFKLQIKENTKAPCHWPLCGEFTDVYIWWRHHAIPELVEFCGFHDSTCLPLLLVSAMIPGINRSQQGTEQKYCQLFACLFHRNESSYWFQGATNLQ